MFGDWALDAAYQDTGGAGADALAAQGKLPSGGSFLPKTSGPSMDFSFITGIFNQGKDATKLFGQSAAGILAADMEARRSRMMTGAIVGLGVVGAVGFLAWWAMKK